MLAATDNGVASCPQFPITDYSKIIKKELGFDNDKLVYGIALGYEDKDADVNSYRTQCANLQEISTFLD